jgi:hypothetical protein
MNNAHEKDTSKHTEWVRLNMYDPSCQWTAKSVRAIVATGLCAPIILGLPFLLHNSIVIDHKTHEVVHKVSGFNLLKPSPRELPKAPKKKLHEVFTEVQKSHNALKVELKGVCEDRKARIDHMMEPVHLPDVVVVIRVRIEGLSVQKELERLGDTLKEEFQDVFAPIPHMDKLLTDVYCRIKLKDVDKTLKTQSYSTPRKYWEAWLMLIQQHLDAGQICPSNSPHASPTFLIPKADETALPRWVNDY